MDDEQKSESKKTEADIIIDENGKETNEEKPEKIPAESGESHWQRFLIWYKSNKKKSVPLTIVVLLLLLAAVPWSRYHIAALALKRDLNLQVIDSTAGTPVSGADISAGSVHAVTDGSGKAILQQVKVGSHMILITKRYYKDSSANILIPIFAQKATPNIKLVATGRQVKISVKNLINQSILADVNIKVAGVSAKTDKSGNATLVLPVGTQSEKATLSLDGYNSADVTIKANDKTIQENDFMLTPNGKVYFLSKLSGKIDVVKTNLDGSSRQTVMAGTGREDDHGTVLLASRDWKYLALLSRRDTATQNPKLYLLNTSDDSVVTMDAEGSTLFSPVGWSDHNFIYKVTRQNIANWQPNAQAIKSYDAESKKITTLDQTKGEGTGQYDYAFEEYGSIYQLGKTVVYDKFWSAYYANQDVLTNKQAGIYSISATGGNAQTLKTFSYAANQNTFVASVPYRANQIYYQVTEKGVNGFYAYNNGKITARSDISDEFNEYYNQGALTYLQSPQGVQTFWNESRDGKNTLFVGDENGENGKQIATLSDYKTYGWYTDDYLLVSKNSSELYVMPKSPNKDIAAIKITDYHKPAQTFNGYGGGYGGL